MKTYKVNLTRDEIFEIGHCLNKEAKHFRELVDDRIISPHNTPQQTIGIWNDHANKLNALTCKLIDAQRGIKS